MSFKKLNTLLLERIQSLNFHSPTPLQKVIIPKIKSGANLFIIGESGSGKTEGMIISVLQKIQMKSVGDNPRAIIFVKDKQAALGLEEKFLRYTEDTSVKVRVAYEERSLEHQKDEIYLGADIVIGTPKRMSKLYFLNGINLMELQLLVIEDAGFIGGTSFHTDINRISQSISKCQHLVFSEKDDHNMEKLRNIFMENAAKLTV